MSESIWKIRRYTATEEKLWNEFIASSRNGTFLFNRHYMEYHAHRFRDFSLIAERNGKISALLAAHSDGDILYSHRGLTYGGWILPPAHVDGSNVLQLFKEWILFCKSEGFREIYYKPIPWFYGLYPSQEDEYALFRCGAIIEKVQLSSTIDLNNRKGFNMSKRQQVRKALQAGLIIEESNDYVAVWKILEECLRERHNTMPVHTSEEIMLLSSRFPNNIKLFTISDDEGLQGGICIFDTGKVAHSQYTASTPKARKKYYIAALYHYLITEIFAERKYFDFGISTENGGLFLNSGLLNQKFSMGGTGTVYTEYKITL